tara:strand:+ start:142 stop:1041 length:900 start_codon:yes stop_codon:yes gene_type:complete
MSSTLHSFSKLALRDGRTLAWREYGATAGYPIIFTHGNLNSSLLQPSWSNTEQHAIQANAKIIAVDRPGYGDSTSHSSRTYIDWASDVAELITHLQIKKFAVVGYSSGGPHALVCAAQKIPGLQACTLISSDAPYYKLGLNQPMYGTENVDLEYATTKAKLNYQNMIQSYKNMSKPERVEIAVADINHAIKNGYHGAASDACLESAVSWGFDLEKDIKMDVSCCPITVWHGTDDHDVPIVAGDYMSEMLGGKYVKLEGENHTLIRRHWLNILKSTIETATTSSTEVESTEPTELNVNKL